MPHNPGDIRVVARATAIIQDDQHRFLLAFHPNQDHYFLLGGKAKYTEGSKTGQDIAETFTHIGRASEFVAFLFNMKRESARAAGVREVWEELHELHVVNPMKWKATKRRFRFVVPPPSALEIVNLHDDPRNTYRPEIDTKNIILPCKMRLPPLWEEEVRNRWLAERDDPAVRTPVVWYATATEIQNVHTTRGLKISPDVRHILLRLKLISPIGGVLDATV